MASDSFKVLQSALPLGDPHICSDSKNRLSLISAVYESLVSRSSPGHFDPCLAEAWRVSNDAKVWEFQLRRGVTCHNRSELKSGDIVGSLERVIGPKVGGAYGTQGVYASYLGGADFKAVDVDRVKITLREPMADLLDLLVEMPIVPEDALDDLPNEHIGSGPYKVRDVDEDEIQMLGNSQYWGGKPAYRKLTWIAEPDIDERARAISARQADVASDVQHAAKTSNNGRDVKYKSRLGGLCVIYMLNCFTGPCRDVRVRRALNLALDKDTIIKEIKGGAAEALNGPITPIHFGWDPEIKVYPHDPVRSRLLIREAGYQDELTLKMDIPAEMPDEAIPLSRLVAKQLKEAGIDVEIRVHDDRPAYANMVRAKRIGDLCCFDSSPISTFRVLREKIHSGLRGPWWEGYANKAVDGLIGQAQRTVDDRERGIIYGAAHRLIHDDAPWIFLYRPEYFWALGAGVDWEPRFDCVTQIR